VRRSVADPRDDARVNVDGLLNVLECAKRHGTRRVIFISSGGVIYGEPDARPTPESAPKLPLSPYGVTKLAAEFYLHYYARTFGLEYVALRYSNVYGPRQDPHGEAGVVAIIAPPRRAGGPGPGGAPPRGGPRSVTRTTGP
jgi:UDP-glucose 4-epimerase